tara:strand:+ start:2017 stop:2745 length:729 start_codon:yes stop_codon:yes gene_type:complete
MQISTKVFIVVLLFFICNTGFGQSNFGFDTRLEDEEYEIENVFGASHASNSGLVSSLFWRHSNSFDKKNLAHYGVELANTRHPRESRQTTITGSSFVIGKSNYLVSIRPYYGREKVLFQKSQQQGVRISAMVSAGPTLGLETPYYVNYRGRKEQYDPNRHSVNNINGTSGPLKGLFESKIVPGLHLKTSMTFETNSTKNRVFGIQAGFILEAFTRKINILPEAENKNVYSAAFIAVYFGKRR